MLAKIDETKRSSSEFFLTCVTFFVTTCPEKGNTGKKKLTGLELNFESIFESVHAKGILPRFRFFFGCFQLKKSVFASLKGIPFGIHSTLL